MVQKYTHDNPFNQATLVQMLRSRALDYPHKTAVIFLGDGEQEEASVTYAELDQSARAVAAWLQQKRVDQGSQALLLYPSGLDFIIAFFGCLYAGVVAVPIYPPRLNRPSPRIQSVVADSEATVALTTTQIYKGLERRFSQMPILADLRWLDTESMPGNLHEQWREPVIDRNKLAFLQYTSGSTGSPKGVMVSHGNLMHNLEMIRRAFHLKSNDIGVFWLPNYHDMGLIGGILEPFYVAGSTVLMAPAAFLQRPVRWLKAISRYKANISGAPNFAYQLCLEKISEEHKQELDLSSWRVAFCGAEPIRPETLNRFAIAFAGQGFKRNAYYPCYGLAEGTLIVSGAEGPAEPVVNSFSTHELAQDRVVPVSQHADGAISMVSCGKAMLGQEILIVDPHTLRRCPANQVGEIWVRGDSVAQGYWRKPEVNQQIFQAYPAEVEDGPYLRTGDLGFLYEDNLYVTGRLKDLIIIHGRNHYPQDIEFTVGRCHPALAEEMGAAFSVSFDGQEKLVIVNEVTRRHRRADVEAVAAAVRRAVALEHQLQIHALVLIKPLSIPRTSSGKIIRHACKQGYLDGSLKVVAQWSAGQEWGVPEEVEPAAEPAEKKDRAAIAAWLAEELARRLRINRSRIDRRTPFVDYGLDSVQAVNMTGDLENWLGRPLSPTLVWDFPTIDDLARHLAGADEQQGEKEKKARWDREPVAVVGIGCRFPGVEGPDAFWQMLNDGQDAISEVPADRWDKAAYYVPGEEPQPGKMNTKWGGFLVDIDHFDASFFAISPREATRMDPQQRLLLEVAWQALEHGGQHPVDLRGKAAGVFIGISSSDYSRRQYSDPELIDAYAGTGNAHSVAANRLSYALDLRGPSMAIDTACSSSLVATHLAMNSLLNGESDVALAGGVNLLLEPDLTITFSQARMMAADGRCKTFDARADGYVRGEGCGILVLKRLSDAERDGDNILALLHGSAVNQDGRSNGLTAPNGPAQQAVIRRALNAAGAQAKDISYIEAHGTGTPLGDPIEVQSLQGVLDGEGDAPPVSLGSVKTNVGHLEAAAGVAGLIKTILALQHERIPSHLHYHEINPHIDLEGSRLRISGDPIPWTRGDRQRLAGVSSFGFGGTNAHIIVGEGPPLQPAGRTPQTHLFTLSARDEKALHELAGKYVTYFESNPDLDLAGVSYTVNTGRVDFDKRLAVTADSIEELARKLRTDNWELGTEKWELRTAFLFTGQGSQIAGMGRGLFETEPVFRDALEKCAAVLDDQMDRPLFEVIFPDRGNEALLNQTTYTQPALFAVEYALAQLWRSWGVEPDVVIGHSVGEVVAAVIAGIMSLEDGLRLIATRGRLMGDLPSGGGMAALFTGEEQVQEAIAPYVVDLSLAAINGPGSVVISGKERTLKVVLQQLAREGVESRPLPVSHAFHSPLMDPILEPMRQAASGIHFRPPTIPFVSNLSGSLLHNAPDADYWADHVRQPVQFHAGMKALAELGTTVFLEIGPQPHLTGMGKHILKENGRQEGRKALWLPSLRPKQADRDVMLNSLGRLYEAGLDVQWSHFYGGRRPRKVPLPTYPFQRERYWLEIEERQEWRPRLSKAQQGNVRRLHTAVPLFESRLDLDDAAGKKQILYENSLAIARLFWDEGQHQVIDLSLTGRLADADGVVLTQTTLSASSGESAFLQTFGAAEEGESWVLLASGQIQRGGVELPSDLADLERVETNDDGLPDLAAPAEAYIPYLQRIVAAVLDLNRDRVALNQPLESLGLDSLMAIELRNRVQTELQIDLPLVDLLQGPTIEQLAARLPGLREAQPQQIAIQPLSDTAEPGPLSYGQQAMWVLHQLLPQDVSFNVAGAARLNGRLDAQALRRATAKLIARHGALRTTFSTSDGRPQQQIQEEVPVDKVFSTIDAAGWEGDKLGNFLQQEAHRPFNLEHGPLMRLVLLRQGDHQHVLLLALNHLITDFWSMALLVQELYQFYTAEVQGLTLDLPAPTLNMADYALWQAQMLAGPEGEKHRSYWHEQLSGALPRLDLPSDRPRPALLTFEGDMVTRHLSPALTEKIKNLSAGAGATLATALLAAFQTLLHRLTGQDDLLVGSVIAGRERPELQDLAGYLINSVAIRADFSGEQAPTFNEVLAQTRQTMLEAMAHQEYPLPLLAEELATSGGASLDPSRPPLFETMFIMQRAQVLDGEGLSAFALGVPGARLDLGDLQVDSMPLGGLPAQFDMTLMMAEVDRGLAAALHYNRQLFDESTVRRLLDHLEQLLQTVVEQPEQPVNEVDLLPVAERQRLLYQWNGTAAPYPDDKTLHQLFFEQAQRTPGAIALHFEGRHWTYAQLDGRAAKAAHRLQQMGVGRGALVAIYMERSLEMMAGLLGILQAGGAYIPLDPDFPAERLDLMLDDAQPLVLLTQQSLVGKIEPPEGTAVCLIEETCQLDPVQAIAHPAGPEDRAYVIYTSGSTGKPKGVQISNRAAVNFLWSMSNEPGISAEDNLLAVTTLSFDIALLELFLPLIHGAQVTIASRQLAMDGYLLGQMIRQANISIMQATPATWRLLLEAGWQGKKDLVILCGGEALQPDLAQKLLPRCAELWNMYGPTETTVWSTMARITSQTNKITIGRPIANTHLYVLDPQMQPVPIGVTGHLYIGGVGLADGYLNRPELTAERFLPDPFLEGQRVYKTGDLARYLADGRLLYLGRDDFQVKIHGYRIELGDIETAVSRHPAVAQTVCLAREYEPGSRRLIAYIVPQPDREEPMTAELRGFLRAQLPDYMIPATFTILDSLPLLPNGKINRRALPDPSGQHGLQETPLAPPRFKLEAQVAELCAHVLDVKEIGIHDSFFDLGGNSLLATRLIFQTREQFQVQIPLRQVFIQPTVAGLSQAILSARQNGFKNGSGLNDRLPERRPGDDPSLAQLEADAALDPAIRVKGLPLAQIEEPGHVLLTGATGFVGAFLLRDLLQESNAIVHCLVRADDEGAGLDRLMLNMATYGLWQESFAERVRAVPGDLARPNFGLSSSRFNQLARQVDVIIHNGALVNFIYSYQEHRAANVLGTEMVLRLATSETLKAVHFVSTLSVFHSGGHDDGRVYYEDEDLRKSGVPFGGYAQSKWAGERMIMNAAARGVPAAIYRPGLVSGDSRSGAWNTADMMSTMIMACATLGAVPDLDVDVDIVPVDYVSRALVALVLQKRPAGEIYNLCNPQTMPYRQVVELVRQAGLPLRVLPFDQWRERLMNMAEQFGNENWNPYLPLLDEVSEEQVFMPTFDCRNTMQALAGSDITCPPVGRELLETYLSYLQLGIRN